MSSWLVIGGAALGAVVLLFAFRASALTRGVRQAISAGDTTALQAQLAALAPDEQPTAYDRAIGEIWSAYERELTVPLIRDLAARHTETRIAQYWLSQLRDVEPELVSEELGREFFGEHYRPEIAASCGRFG
ncbi:MAG: hypothetical protein KC503_21910 [Myxococcales bacterium]|nr:hypothetical protein [Myxococcales bacterium]